MARKIIIQERINEPSDFSFRFVMWVDVPVARQSFYAEATKGSAVKDVTAAELVALRTGAVLEFSETAEFPAGTTGPAVQAGLVQRFNVHQTQVTSLNPWRFFGTFWDGTSWTVLGAS